MKEEYLPSKQFIKRFISVIILVAGVFAIYKIIIFIKNKSPKNNVRKGVEVVQSIQKDSNDNGIPDWEETLWGLNPKKDGESNKEFILNKRKTLNTNNNLENTDQALTENDTLAREFFSVVMSLQQTGNLDNQAIQSIGDAASEKIVAEPIPNKYTIDMMKVIADTPDNISKYYSDFQNLAQKYSDRNIGDELTYLIQAIAYDDPQVVDLVKSVGVAYGEFGAELMEIPTPSMISPIILGLANSYEKNAESIDGLTKVFSDPIIATKSIINYKKYNDELVTLINSLSYVFESN